MKLVEWLQSYKVAVENPEDNTDPLGVLNVEDCTKILLNKQDKWVWAGSNWSRITVNVVVFLQHMVLYCTNYSL